MLGAAVAAPGVTIAKQRRAQPSNTDPDWLTYRNERYAFRLSYPPAGRVETRREHGFQHIVIGVAEAKEPQPTGDGYHVDVLIYDHRLGHNLKLPCRDLLHDLRAVKLGKIQGWRGSIQDDESDTPAEPAVCVESRKVVVLIKASDADAQASLANRILDTLRFGE